MYFYFPRMKKLFWKIKKTVYLLKNIAQICEKRSDGEKNKHMKLLLDDVKLRRILHFRRF